MGMILYVVCFSFVYFVNFVLSFKAHFKMFLMILRVQYILFIIFFNIYCLVLLLINIRH